VLKARGAPAEEVAAHLLAGEPAGDMDNLVILRAAADPGRRGGRAAGGCALPRASRRGVRGRAGRAASAAPRTRALGSGSPVTTAAQATLTRAFQESVGTAAHIPAAIELAATAYSRADNRVVQETVRAVGGVEMTATSA
jgi:hypothetical protein